MTTTTPETTPFVLEQIQEAPEVELVIPVENAAVPEPTEVTTAYPASATADLPEDQDPPLGQQEDIQNAQASPEVMQQRLQVLGGITWLMLQSPQHWHCTIEELEARILPSLTLGQFRYYEVSGQPLGFVSWAYLSAEAEEKYQTGGYQLLPQEWRSGEQLWCIDFISPFDYDQSILDDLSQSIFPQGTTAKMIRTQADGSRSIVEYQLGARES
ncbi:toxin-activating lysine-acyltransferase [Acaryochloris sp. IP29b_bin.137]|uniref:toxin-activating lysine-acyltransferase n=1 Tax=Acaryochloris sp. IP29b_bin.137 TaxID=2969217 RepID=UPI00262C0F2C|nr:toxin-activating lysine-acyltransferase [Acaryochloris sp. IP29b_bin.137]